MTTREGEQPCTQSEDFLRLPGLFRRWEIEQVIQNSDEFHISAAGATEDGSDLFAVYCRERPLAPLIEGGSR
ncbi:MAG TPA: hypothetical protein VKT78_00555 [Fimbriimonadaceae bacterium]|nr:hypothetical protein [Fimbriimonadaceae bacterium]